MTIGDEKVVQRWTPEIFEDEQDGQIVAGMDPYTEGKYVLHSAYAELAAERDRLQTAYDGLAGEKFSDRNHAALQSRARTAESQLAELRGRVEELAKKWEREEYENVMAGADGGQTALSGDECADQLRTLAAADGATTGETK